MNVRPAGDVVFVQIVDAALADAASRGGDWLACRPGCHQCCVGVFPISPLDAERLRDGLASLSEIDSQLAQRIRHRVAASALRLRDSFPGNIDTGILGDDDDAQARFVGFGNDEVCPVLDPLTGICDLYSSRPLTCRTFGPPVRTEDGHLGVCELCFVSAPETAIAAAEMHLPPPEMEAELSQQTGRAGETLIAFALRSA